LLEDLCTRFRNFPAEIYMVQTKATTMKPTKLRVVLAPRSADFMEIFLIFCQRERERERERE
jgi:hypothetical protein